MKGKIVLACLTVLLITLTAAHFVVYASAPQQISHQGYLTDSNGNPVLDGDYLIGFAIYDIQTGGTALWNESQTVTVTNGVYNVILGQPGNLLDSAVFDGDIYLGITVESDSEMTPRKKLTSTAFSLKAAKADDADTLDGLDSTNLDQSAHVADTGNPHVVTAAQIGAATTSDITWANLPDVPAGFSDGVDNVGISAETDPTVLSSVKDGIAWGEISSRPSGLDDGDDVGIMIESDPEVGSISSDYIPKWNGSQLVSGTIYDDGNVGIGTATPTEKLDVDGAIRIRGGSDLAEPFDI